MKQAFEVHLQGIKIGIASRMAYRADLFISMTIMLIQELIAPLVTILIYNAGAQIPGYSMYQALLIQGVFMLSRGISFPFFFGMVGNTIWRVRNGSLDLLLIKPRSALRMLIVTGFETEDLGKLVGGIALFIVSIAHLPMPGPLQWLEFALLFMVSIVFMFDLALLFSGIGIIWVGNYMLFGIFNSTSDFGRYPLSIFSKSLQTIIAIIFPVSALGFIPATALLGSPSAFSVVSLLSVFVLLLINYLFFKRMLKRYSSGGG